MDNVINSHNSANSDFNTSTTNHCNATMTTTFTDSNSAVTQLKSINNKQHITLECIFDIIAITETWLTDHIYTNEVFPTGYTDRDGRGGACSKRPF